MASTDPKSAADDGSPRRAYEAENGTVFDTTYRDYADVYVAEGNTVIAKPTYDEEDGD